MFLNILPPNMAHSLILEPMVAELVLPHSLIGRTFLLLKTDNSEQLRATITEKFIETSQQHEDLHEQTIKNINFLVKVGQ